MCCSMNRSKVRATTSTLISSPASGTEDACTAMKKMITPKRSLEKLPRNEKKKKKKIHCLNMKVIYS